jgi:hypothetical protein
MYNQTSFVKCGILAGAYLRENSAYGKH